MPRQSAVAVSDIAVALSALYAALIQSRDQHWAIGGFTLIAIAASFGVLRFGSERPLSWLQQTHVMTSWFAKLLGMPALSIAYLEVTTNPYFNYKNYLIVAALLTLVITKFLPHKSKQTPTDAISGLAVIGIVINSYHRRFYGILGAVGYLMGGIVLESNFGEQVMSPVASFHYIIALANLALGWGLLS